MIQYQYQRFRKKINSLDEMEKREKKEMTVKINDSTEVIFFV